MTVTPPRERARRPGRPRRAVAAVIALAVALTPLLGTVAAGAATPSPTPTPAIPAGTTVFTLAPVGAGVVRPGERLTVTITLQNGTADPLPAGAVTLGIGGTPLPDRSALASWLAGGTAGVQTQDVATAGIDEVPAGGTEVTGIGVEADDPALQDLAPGVYPLIATYTDRDSVTAATSVMIVPDADASVTGIGVVVPITAAARSEGLLTHDELAALTAADGELTSILDAVAATASILAVDPAIPAAIRVLGTAAPASAVDWLDRLMELPQSRFALQFGDADVAVQLEAGLSRPLAPTSLSAYLDPADFIPDTESTPTATPAPTPTDAIDPDAPVYPELDALLDIGSARAGVFWPAPGTAGPQTVATLGGLTVDEMSSLTLVPSSATVPGASGATVSARARAGDVDILVYDSDVSRALQQASLIDQNSRRGAALSEATAYLAFASAESAGAPVLVTLDRATGRDRIGLGRAIAAATQAPGFVPLTLGRIAAGAARDIEIADAAADPVRVSTASALFADETDLSQFATILDDTSLITGPERAEILQLLGIAWLADPPAWGTAAAEHRAETAVTLDSVDLLPTSTINLFGSEADLGFWVRNDLSYPVNLILYARRDNLRLDVQPATPLVAGARSNTRVEVPVQARIGNGEVTLSLQLRSRASVAIGDGATVQVNVRAEWESVGIIALSVVVGGLVVLGIMRTVLRVRARRRRPAPGAGAAGPDDSAVDDSAADGDGEVRE